MGGPSARLPKAREKICFEFANHGSCSVKNCRYLHSQQNEPQRSTDRRQRKVDQPSGLVFWKIDARNGCSRPLGCNLGKFFVTGEAFLQADESTLQDVIRCLASEGGLRRVQELVQRDFASISTTHKQMIFREEALPFMRMITCPNVLSSLVLEQAVVTIYNCLFGPQGSRATPFLAFLAGQLELEVQNNEATALEDLELSLLVFSQIMDLNSTAFIQPPLGHIAEQFATLLNTLHGMHSGDSSVYQSCQYLERLQRRLNIGLALPALHGLPKRSQRSGRQAKFMTKIAPPGGRHDNDNEDICKIQIMPTFQEIVSPRSEYLPVKDPRQWHIDGIAALLDRNFRLLREDTIGQLRDTIHAELQQVGPNGSRKTQVRTHVYRKATVQDLEAHRFAGLQFLVQFQQPNSVRGEPERKREEWWSLSKRLQPSGFVCLVDSRGFAIFCTVASPDKPSPRSMQNKKQQQKLIGSLSGHQNLASVVLELAEPNEHNWQRVLDCYASKHKASSLSLVEFPGILLPSFLPTLLALQKMKQIEDIPMSEFLTPNSEISTGLVAEMPPPLYAISPGFRFELSCLMNDNTSLHVHHSEPVDLERLRSQSTLDDAQALAVVRTLQRRVGLIQGPPGTGKSYTGVALIKVLLANKSKVMNGLGPIICVCYTNHALDQLLEALVKGKITSQVIRIGSQSKSEVLESLNLRTVSQTTDKTRIEKTQQLEMQARFEHFQNKFQELRLHAWGSALSLKHYLMEAQARHHDQLFGEDEEGFKRRGSNAHSVFDSWLKNGQPGSHKPRSASDLQEVNIATMTTQERKLLHDFWLTEDKKRLHDRAQSLLHSHREAKATWDQVREEVDLRCLRQADIIGVTTTGLARNLAMLRKLRSKVLVCEEAGEVLEAHLLTSLLPSLEHVILIGDHEQLRPQIQNYELSRESKTGERYSLDTSLFERLVHPDDEFGIRLPFCTLETQRRMAPSIARLIRETLYPKLQDAPSVLNYPEIVGMRKRLFWLDHRHPEGGISREEEMTTSHWNDHEIRLTSALVDHLVRQGTYRSDDIAVLTPYLSQLHRLRRELGERFAIALGDRDQQDLVNAGLGELEPEMEQPNISKSTLLRALRVATIDNFQGEEATVVVISLVRSNSENHCGFLRTSNRINVLLSRAKHGMYIIGNSETSSGVEMWRKVINILREDGNIGFSLDLSCPRHPDTPISVTEPDDFVRSSPEGGCSLQCGKRLHCGHPCKQKCHSEMLHMAVFCPEPCPRPQKGCTHPCPKLCGDRCPVKCQITVFVGDRVLPCGHDMDCLPCWQAQDLTTFKCPTLVQREVSHCEHKVTVACHIDVNAPLYRCPRTCHAVLPCGHSCKQTCYLCIHATDEGLMVEHGSCKQRCGRPYSTCAHACSADCHGEEPCPPCTSPCDMQCGHSKCPQKCFEPCPPCAVSECLSSCPHSTCLMPCAAPCDHVPCSLRCEKVLSCGHRCPSVCGEACPPETFCQICGSDDIKDTLVDFIVGETYKEIDLDTNPCVFPQCGHFLTMENMDAQMDLKQHYVVDELQRPISISSSSKPFLIDDIKVCAICRGSLRNISRYGRLVRRALIDQATKKFILYVNQRYVPMAQDLSEYVSELQDSMILLETRNAARRIFQPGVQISIKGPLSDQVQIMARHLLQANSSRWKSLLALRVRLSEYQKRVEMEEQPFNQVRNMVVGACRRKQIAGQFAFDETVLQMKGHILASALLLRLDLALLGDFVSLKKTADRHHDMVERRRSTHYRIPDFGGIPGPTQHKAELTQQKSELKLDLKENRSFSKSLISNAMASHRVYQRAEGNMFLAQLCALERENITDKTEAESLRQQGQSAIEEAELICDLHPGETRGLAGEIEGTKKMLGGSTFYTPVTSEERMAVVNAMSRELRGTGHWYYCENGHPFTIGECGMAMEISQCPECGSPVGGRNHTAIDGVTYAGDLEEGLQGMRF